jgi:predicted nucleotidyltransferase
MDNAVHTKESLLERISGHRSQIRAFGVKELGLFGSFARDTSINEQSDVDLLVEFEPDKKSFDNFMDLSFYLEELLGRKVEIVTPQSLSKYIGPHILKQVQHVAL